MTHLSPREREVVELVGGDLKSYKAAAGELRISEHTVRAHVYRIVQRIGTTLKARDAIIDLYRRELVSTSAVSRSGDF